VALQVNPAKPPQALGTWQAFVVHASIPSEQPQMLQPSPAGMVPEPSGYVTPLTTQLRPDPEQGPACRTPLPAAAAMHELAYV
jgi:hypothetical protein